MKSRKDIVRAIQPAVVGCAIAAWVAALLLPWTAWSDLGLLCWLVAQVAVAVAILSTLVLLVIAGLENILGRPMWHQSRHGVATAAAPLRLAALLPTLVAVAMTVLAWNFARHGPRMGPRPGARNDCINNLRQIDGAKEQLALDKHLAVGTMVSETDLYGTDNYIRERPRCLAKGKYSINPIGTPPTCSITNHVLPRSIP